MEKRTSISWSITNILTTLLAVLYAYSIATSDFTIPIFATLTLLFIILLAILKLPPAYLYYLYIFIATTLTVLTLWVVLTPNPCTEVISFLPDWFFEQELGLCTHSSTFSYPEISILVFMFIAGFNIKKVLDHRRGNNISLGSWKERIISFVFLVVCVYFILKLFVGYFL